MSAEPVIRTTCLAIGLCLVLLANDARSAEALHVIVAGDGSPELARKLRAEVSYAGFRVADGATMVNDATNTAARSAAATLSVLSAHRVMLEFSRPEGDTVERRILATLPGEGDSFALRVVELLRARLVRLGWQLPDELEAAPTPSSTERADRPDADEPRVRPAPVEAALPNPSESLTLWVGGGATASAAVGGLGWVPHVQFMLRAEVPSTWGVSLGASQPLASAEVDGSEGEAQVLWHALTAAVYVALPLESPWFAQAGAGGGLLLLDVRGEASDGYTGRRDDFIAGSGHVELGGGHYLWDWLRLRVDVTTGLTAPRPVVRFDDREVATLGRFYGSVGLSLEVGLGAP